MRGRYALFSIAIGILFLLLLEALVRISGLVNIHLTRGWGHSFACCGDLRPNQHILSLIVEDHPYMVQTNNLGLRNVEETILDQDATFRILTIGDSYTFGPYVANDETWPARLEQMLREQYTNRSLEVLNAGIASYTITDELAYFTEKGLALAPDLVILEVTFNDIADMRKIQRGLFKRPTAGDWKVETKWAIKNFLYDHSYFVAALVKLKNARVAQNILTSQEAGDDALYESILYGDNHEYEEAYEEAFARLVSLAREHDVPLAALFYPESGMVSQNPVDDNQTKMAAFVTGLGKTYNVPVLDASTFLRDADTHLTYLLPWNGHPSTTGYYLTAQNLLHFLNEQHILP